MTEPGPQECDYRYAAFISYRHVEPDRGWAKWVHRALEAFRTPKSLVTKGVRSRIGRVFRDEEELPASADLSKEIDLALEQARFLIVVCSPRTPKSEWVNQEVVRFREMGRHDRILALLVEGEPAEAFPRALREIRTEIVDECGNSVEEIERVEPLAADVRESRDEPRRHLQRMARLRFAAALLGCRFDDLRRREDQRRRRRLMVTGSVLLALVVLFAGLTAFAFRERSRADDKAAEARVERDAKAAALEERSRALEDVMRLSDTRVLRELLDEEATLSLARPEIAEAAEQWVRKAEALLERRAEHARALERLRAKSEVPGPPWTFGTAALRWQHEVLSDLIERLSTLSSPEGGAIARVRALALRARKLWEESVEARRAEWQEAVQRIAADPRYGGLRMPPQLGLVPLGRDPRTGLHEFAHVGSGRVLAREQLPSEDMGIVFVLVPPGRLWMGGPPEGTAPHALWTREARRDEQPAREVVLDAFLLAKYECTQGQWRALTGRPNMGFYGPMELRHRWSARLPAETVDWTECTEALHAAGLRLPTEAEWEYACRAGTTGDWSCTEEALPQHAWLRYRGQVVGTHDVGDLLPNAFGLHDMHGNVREWVRDHRADTLNFVPENSFDSGYRGQFADLRVARGGARDSLPADARSACRSWHDPGYRQWDVGLRPARTVIFELDEPARDGGE